MADNEKPLLDFSSWLALAGSIKDTAVRWWTAVVEWVKKGYDAVANTTQDAIDTTKAVVTGTIELPDWSPEKAAFIEQFATPSLSRNEIDTLLKTPVKKGQPPHVIPLLSKEEMATIEANGYVDAKMVQSILIPRLMGIDNQAKLHKLRTTFQTHGKLSALIDIYGFAPITKGEAIPRSQANTSQFVREAKLTGKQAWSDLVQWARSYWNLNTEMDDLAVGRHLIAMRWKWLISAISSIYWNEAVADNPEYLNTSWWFTQWRKWDDLAEALQTRNNDKFKDITLLTPKYSRSTLHNDYILALVHAASDPNVRSIVIDGIKIDFPKDEAQKLEEIANELDAMREWVEQSNPEGFRQFMSWLAAFKEWVWAVIHVGGMAFGITLEMMQYPLTSWIALSTIAVAAKRWDPTFGKKSWYGRFASLPWRAVVWTARMATWARNYWTPEERESAKALAPDPKWDLKKFVDTKRDELREEYKRLKTARSTLDARNIERRLSELDKYYADYETRYATWNLRSTDRPNTIKAEIENIAQGKGRRLSAIAWDVMKWNFSGATDRIRAHIKSFGTAEGYAEAQNSFETAIKWTKADLRTVTVGGEVLHYELINKSAHSSVYEKIAQDLEKFEKYQKWKALYEVYETRRVALARSEWQVKYITEALKAGAGSAATPGWIWRMISISAEWQAAAEWNREQAQKRVEASVEAMSELKTGFDTSKLTINIDASGNVTANNADVIKAFEKKFKAVVKSIDAGFTTLWIKPGEIDISLRGAEENKGSVLERIGKKATVAAKK